MENNIFNNENNTQETFSNEESVNQILPDDNIEEEKQEYYPPIVELAPADKSDPENKKGLRVFCLLLALVLLFTFGTATGYFFGRSKNEVKPNIELNLEPKPSDKNMLSEAEVYQKTTDSVVGIAVYNSTAASSGSGVVYSEDGYIITNDHIYDGVSAAKFKIYMSDGNEYDAEYVAGDTRSDLAVLKIKQKVKLVPATIGNSEELYVGEPVVAMGRPTGANTKNNITSGIVSLLDSRLSVTSSYSTKHIQTNAAINPGSSGGALLNMYGQVVGITSSKIAGSEYEGMGFAVPSTTVKKVIESLISKGYVENRAKLGISYYEVDSVSAEVGNIEKGFCIADIDKSSDIYGKAEIGDTITAVNGTAYVDSGTILDVIENAKPGDSIVLTISTKSGVKDISVKLLPDRGSSSYVAVEKDDSNNKDTHNSSEFSFPFGD